ncbi:MAG: fibronectin type III domain-containing protein [Bacteroidales bacterium]|jgi:hypothetical protein|nr:fibronectin type III domain-containing protein [Bacteroidales bacterium]
MNIFSLYRLSRESFLLVLILLLCTVAQAQNPIQLQTQDVLYATDISDNQFTAHWSAVENASGYIVRVFSDNTEVQSVSVSDASQLSVVCDALSPHSEYTFSVESVGDNVHFSNSEESAQSVPFRTISSEAVEQCETVLYNTDFTDWTAGVPTSSNYSVITSGAGKDFQWRSDFIADPTGDGFLEIEGNNRDLICKPLTFIEGGYITFRITNNESGSKSVSLRGSDDDENILTEGTLVDFYNPSNPAPAVILGTNSIDIPRESTYDVIMKLPSSVSGEKNLILNARGVFDDFSVHTYAGTNSLISSDVSETGLSFAALTGGNYDMKYTRISACNLSSDISVEVVAAGNCDDVGRFSVPQQTISYLSAEHGVLIPVLYTSSVVSGVHCATLRVSDEQNNEIFVNLSGVSTPDQENPVILTENNTIVFSTSLISKFSKSLSVIGSQLTDDVEIEITGPDAQYFSISEHTVSSDSANSNGKNIIITYTGGIESPEEHTARLILTSTGANQVEIPLSGQTFSVQPTLYTLILITEPSQAGVIERDISGLEYARGTQVEISAIPESGYRFVRWTDITDFSSTRSVRMNSNIIITAVFEKGESVDVSSDELTAYNPDASTITTTAFVAHWSESESAFQYTIRVYDSEDNLVQSYETTEQSITIENLPENSSYTYQVETDTGERSEISGPYMLTPDESLFPACGE